MLTQVVFLLALGDQEDLGGRPTGLLDGVLHIVGARRRVLALLWPDAGLCALRSAKLMVSGSWNMGLNRFLELLAKSRALT